MSTRHNLKPVDATVSSTPLLQANTRLKIIISHENDFTQYNPVLWCIIARQRAILTKTLENRTALPLDGAGARQGPWATGRMKSTFSDARST